MCRGGLSTSFIGVEVLLGLQKLPGGNSQYSQTENRHSKEVVEAGKNSGERGKTERICETFSKFLPSLCYILSSLHANRAHVLSVHVPFKPSLYI